MTSTLWKSGISIVITLVEVAGTDADAEVTADVSPDAVVETEPVEDTMAGRVTTAAADDPTNGGAGVGAGAGDSDSDSGGAGAGAGAGADMVGEVGTDVGAAANVGAIAGADTVADTGTDGNARAIAGGVMVADADAVAMGGTVAETDALASIFIVVFGVLLWNLNFFT